ncbi:MAG: hypothetical protein ACRENN_09775 [Candidatus Eiseniibacteriota bacterium]
MTSKRVFLAILTLSVVLGGAIGAGGTDPSHKSAAPAKATPSATATPSTPAGGAHEGHAMPSAAGSDSVKGSMQTIVVEVMDPACFLEAGAKSIGPGHFQCAVDCAASGQTLAFYDRVHDRIYFIAGELPGKNPNDPVRDYIHKKVDVTGVVYHRSEAWGIVIHRVALHKEK